MKDHEKCGPHNIAQAMWMSKGHISSALGTLPPHVHSGILTSFCAVYNSEKRNGALQDLPGHLSFVEISAGFVIPSHRTRDSAREILREVAAPFRAAQGTIIKGSRFLAVASDSATDAAAQKAQLVYYRTMVEGKANTAFLSCQALAWGTAPGIFSAY